MINVFLYAIASRAESDGKVDCRWKTPQVQQASKETKIYLSSIISCMETRAVLFALTSSKDET